MEHDTNPSRDIEQLKKQVRVLSYVLGVSIIIIALILTYTLPSVIQNNTFRIQWRVHHDAQEEQAGDMDSAMTDGMIPSDTEASSTVSESAP